MDATVNHETNALCLANTLRNQLYIKLLYLPTTTSQIKHTSGLKSNSFKTRFANHKTSFSYVKKKHATELTISGNLKIKMLTTTTATSPIDATCVCGKNISSSATRL